MAIHAPPIDDTAARLVDALNQDRFVLHQQPIVPISAEAQEEGYQEIYVRFKEEEEKLLPPGTFIPVLESSHLMHLLDRWVVNRVIKWMHACRRQDAQWSAPCCSINLSNDSLADADTAAFVLRQAQQGRISGRKLAFEIAEEDGHAHQPHLAELAHELRAIGCRFTLTSYTGSHLVPERLPELGVESVKLDAGIVTTLHSNPESVRTARRLQAACRCHGLRTIAEFVERQDTLEHLIGLGVHYAQGFGIGRSRPLYGRELEVSVSAPG